MGARLESKTDSEGRVRIARVFALALLVKCGCATRPTDLTPATPTRPEPPQALAADLVEAMDQETVALVRVSSKGDGFSEVAPGCSGVWVGEHTIATAEHCARGLDLGAAIAYVTHADLLDGDRVTVKKVRYCGVALHDPANDLALLTAINPPPHPFARLRVEEPRVGEVVHTMGHPLGMWWSYSSGHVAALHARAGVLPGLPLVQTTAPISPGNSGCGLFDNDGRLIGIGSQIRQTEEAPFGANLGFFVPSARVHAALQRVPS